MAFNNHPIPSVSSPPIEDDMPNFISAIFSAVTLQDRICSDGANAVGKCIECNEFLCDRCIKVHARIHITHKHTIEKFGTVNNALALPSQVTRRSSSQRSSVSSTSAPIIQICDTHQEPHKLYCETCYQSICIKCNLKDHTGHQLSYIEEALNNATANNYLLKDEVSHAMKSVKHTIGEVQKMSEKIEAKASKSSYDVNVMVRRFKIALQKREALLNEKISVVKKYKLTRLCNQEQQLIMTMSRLSMFQRLLNDSLDPANELDPIVVNERVSCELRNLRSIQLNLFPCEIDNITFKPTDPGFFQAVNCLGTLTLESPSTSNALVSAATVAGAVAISGQELVCYNNFTLEQNALVAMPDYREILTIPDASWCRPIYNAEFPIIAKKYGPRPSAIFGSTGENSLCRPWGVCCNSAGHIIVVDRSNNRIVIFDVKGNFIHKFGKEGSAPGQFNRPTAVTVSPIDNLIICDKDNHRIQVFTMSGLCLFTFGSQGSENGQFNYPWDVACNSLGQIVVTDTRNHRIQLFTSEGSFISKYGFETTPKLWRHFDSPRGVCFSPSGKIIVSDFNNHRLMIIDTAMSKPQFLGQEGSGHKQFVRPQGIICDDQGRIIIADTRNHRIQVFDNSGNFLYKFGHIGLNPGEFTRPASVCLTPDGHIVVVDFGNNRIQVF